MDQYCRLNKSRRKIHPLKFGDMSDDEVLLKRMLEDLQRHDARALTEAENEMVRDLVFEATGLQGSELALQVCLLRRALSGVRGAEAFLPSESAVWRGAAVGDAQFFRAMQHYTREFMELWAWRYAVKGKLLMNFLEEFSSMHGLLFSAKHCGLKTSLQVRQCKALSMGADVCDREREVAAGVRPLGALNLLRSTTAACSVSVTHAV